VNLKLAYPAHDWLIVEGTKCHSPEDVGMAADRFMEKWPRIRPEVLDYICGMLTAQLHPRTSRPSQIIDDIRTRKIQASFLRHRWWQRM
jgi:hypothetical protein